MPDRPKFEPRGGHPGECHRLHQREDAQWQEPDLVAAVAPGWTMILVDDQILTNVHDHGRSAGPGPARPSQRSPGRPSRDRASANAASGSVTSTATAVMPTAVAPARLTGWSSRNTTSAGSTPSLPLISR